MAVSQVEIGGRLTTRAAPNIRITAGVDDTVIRPAGQVIAGVSLKLTPRLNADLTYRLFYVPEVKWDISSDYTMSGALETVPCGLEHFRGDLIDQSLSLALRWNFDFRL